MHPKRNTRLSLALLLSAPLLLPLPGHAETLTLDRAETMALSDNPALAAAGAETEALAAMPPQVGSLPDPTLSMNALNLPVNSFSASAADMSQLQLGISQAIPFPGKLGLRAEAAERMAEAAVSNRDEFRLMLLRNVRLLWWNLAYLDKAIDIVRDNQALLRSLVRISETKYKTGSGLQQDVLLAQLELSHLLERELMLNSERATQAAALNALLGRSADRPIELPATLPDTIETAPDVASLKAWAREHRPLLQALSHKFDASDSRVALAEKDYYPDFKLGAAYGFRQGRSPATGMNRPDMASVMLSMSLPIYTGSKQDRAVEQRKAERARAGFERQDAIYRVDAEIDAAATELATAIEQLTLFRQGILPQAHQTTASMLAGYQVNNVDFLNLVRARLAEFNNDIRYWQQISKTHQAEARLLAAAGLDTLNKDVPNHE